MEKNDETKSPLKRNDNENLEKALEVLGVVEKICCEIHEDTADACDEVGDAFWHLKQYDQALQYYDRAFKIRKEIFGENHETAKSYFNIGNILFCQNKADKALEYYQKAFDLEAKKYKKQKVFLLKNYDVISLCYKSLCNYEKAIQFSLEAYEIRKEILGEHHDSTVRNKSRLMDLYKKASDELTEKEEYDKALEYAREIFEYRKETLGEKNIETVNALIDLGFIYQEKEDFINALKCGLEVLDFLSNEFGEDHPYTLTFYGNVGSTYISLKNYKQALDYLEKGYAICINKGDEQMAKDFQEKIEKVKNSGHLEILT